MATSLSFKHANGKSSGPKWLIVRINDEEYMMQFIPEDFQQLNNLKVNDKIIRSHSDYIERNNKVLFKRDFGKNNGC